MALLGTLTACSSASEGPVVAYTASTGEACSPSLTGSRDYVVVESFINEGHHSARLQGAAINGAEHVHLKAGPFSYPGTDAGIRVVPYPLPSDKDFAAARAAWKQRTPLSGLTLKPGAVVYVALVLERDRDASAGTVKDVQLNYRVGQEQHQNVGAFSYRVQAGACA